MPKIVGGVAAALWKTPAADAWCRAAQACSAGACGACVFPAACSKLAAAFFAAVPGAVVFVVCPARVRYGKIVAEFAADSAAPLRARELLRKEPAWRAVCRGRLQAMGKQALPFFILFAFFIVLYLFFDAFSILHILLAVFGGIATVLGTMATFLPRLLLGKSMVLDAGAIGGIAALAAAFAVSLLLFGLAVFRTSPYRFGAAGKQKVRAMLPLMQQNLRLWLPTLVLSVVLLIVAYPELSLLLANVLGAAPLFAVKLRLHQIILLALTAISYLLLLPVRRYNTAAWSKKNEE